MATFTTSSSHTVKVARSARFVPRRPWTAALGASASSTARRRIRPASTPHQGATTSGANGAKAVRTWSRPSRKGPTCPGSASCSATSTWASPARKAASVPGTIERCSSATSAVRVRRGSTTRSRPPRSRRAARAAAATRDRVVRLRVVRSIPISLPRRPGLPPDRHGHHHVVRCAVRRAGRGALLDYSTAVVVASGSALSTSPGHVERAAGPVAAGWHGPGTGWGGAGGKGGRLPHLVGDRHGGLSERKPDLRVAHRDALVHADVLDGRVGAVPEARKDGVRTGGRACAGTRCGGPRTRWRRRRSASARGRRRRPRRGCSGPASRRGRAGGR